jgi:hypothetical protein
MIQVNDLYVEVFQLDETFRGSYKIYFAYYDYQEQTPYFSYLDKNGLHWFSPNKYFKLIDIKEVIT